MIAAGRGHGKNNLQWDPKSLGVGANSDMISLSN